MLLPSIWTPLSMGSAGTIFDIAAVLYGNLPETLKPGLYPAAYWLFSRSGEVYSGLWTAGNSSRFSGPAPVEVYFIATLTEAAYCLAGHPYPGPEMLSHPFKTPDLRFGRHWLKHLFLPVARRIHQGEPVKVRNCLYFIFLRQGEI